MAEHAQAFCTAAFKGDLAALREVLARHPGVLNSVNDRSQTALYCAAMRGQEAIVDYLLQQPGISLNKRDNGSTALHVASWNDHVAIIPKLLTAGADLFTPNNHGELPLHNARSDAVKALFASHLSYIAPKSLSVCEYLREQANNSNDHAAWYRLALLYSTGDGQAVEADANLALEAFKKAADLGNADAQYHMGHVEYQNGNKKEAFALFEEAAKSGHKDALFNIGILRQRGEGVIKDFVRGVQSMKEALPPFVLKSTPVNVSAVKTPKLIEQRRVRSSERTGASSFLLRSSEITEIPRFPLVPISSLDFSEEERVALAKEHLLAQITWPATDLLSNNPPLMKHDSKKLIFDLTMSERKLPDTTLRLSRWLQIPAPHIVPTSKFLLRINDGFYQYGEEKAPSIAWHVNFADSQLFRYYGGQLFAQDEILVAEHPLLAALREALAALSDAFPLTAPKTREALVKGSNEECATPILIRNVPRMCTISVDPNESEGRPGGLYGSKFALASPEAIKAAVKIHETPSLTNLICMLAPKYGRGAYTEDQLEYAFLTAYTAFVAARLQSFEADNETVCTNVIVHTGHWGTGAFGGNKVVMAFLQILAAKIAGVTELVYHANEDRDAVEEAQRKILQFIPSDSPIDAKSAIKKLLKQNYQWGTASMT